MPQDVGRQKIIDYIVKVYEEREVPPSAREINREVGNNNNGYLYEFFPSIDDAYRASPIGSIGNRSLKTQAATLARKKEYQQAAEVVDLTSLGQQTEEDEVEEEEHGKDFPTERLLVCWSCGRSLHWDEENYLLCPTCRRRVRCRHGEAFLFSRFIDLARANCGCWFKTPDRQNRTMDHLWYDPDYDTFRPYPPGKPSGFFLTPDGRRIPL